jgi:hypothetical protein
MPRCVDSLFPSNPIKTTCSPLGAASVAIRAPGIPVDTEIQQKLPRWVRILLGTILLIGCGTVVFGLWKVALALGL